MGVDQGSRMGPGGSSVVRVCPMVPWLHGLRLFIWVVLRLLGSPGDYAHASCALPLLTFRLSRASVRLEASVLLL